MLQNLNAWRARCSEAQLAAFDHKLCIHCGTAVISPANLNKRYNGSYHRALINSKVLHEAVKTRDYIIRGSSFWGSELDAGREFCTELADLGGCMPVNKVDRQYAKSIPLLLERGIVFECDGDYHLPAEVVMEYRSKSDGASWLTLTAKTSLPMLHQLAPQDAQQNMLKPPIRNELAAWLAIHGAQARQSNPVDQLAREDWILLLTLQHHDIDSFDELRQLYPEFEPVHAPSYSYYSVSEQVNLRKSLEAEIPEQLCKLARLGLIGIVVQNGHETYASVTLCDEARKLLNPHLKRVRSEMAKQLRQNWLAEPCDIEQPSPWSMDQLIWRLWVALHFLSAGITQQGRLRKAELKRIAKLLAIEDAPQLEFLIIAMLNAGLLQQQQSQITAAPVNWNKWRSNMRQLIYRIVSDGRAHWNKTNEKQVFDLLAKLPVSCWLNLDDVVHWLELKATGNVLHASWRELFSEYQSCALHHVNISHQRIFFLPQFHAAVTQQAVDLAAPGWHGADKKAKLHGFISAAGEIQLPPDCNHRILPELADFCTLTSVEQMITLQLDHKALKRMGSDKVALKQTRVVLESLQSPLPQAVVYLFEKQQSQKPLAATAATSMVVLLHEASAIHQLRKTGFALSQPFKDKPEIILLDASADPHAFLSQCNDHGILLDTLIKPVAWISGTASIKAWMESNINREDHWLEICYQKTRSSKPKQLFARIEDDYHGLIYIQGTRKTRQGFTLLKSSVRLEPKHVLRLRELDDAEVKELNLDQLS